MKSKRKGDLGAIFADDFDRIFGDSDADRLSKYQIERVDGRTMRFRNKGYTLFVLSKDETGTVALSGLDGYGMRDREFRRYVAELVHKLTEKNAQF